MKTSLFEIRCQEDPSILQKKGSPTYISDARRFQMLLELAGTDSVMHFNILRLLYNLKVNFFLKNSLLLSLNL